MILVFAAVLAAIMSTADSALLSMGSMFTKDIYKAYLRKDASDEHLLLVGKSFAFGVLALLVFMAWVSLETESSIWFLIRLKLEFMVQLAPAVILGVRWERLRALPVLAGMVLGTVLTIVLWSGVTFGWFPTRSPLGINAGAWGLMVNLGTCCVLQWVGGRRSAVRG